MRASGGFFAASLLAIPTSVRLHDAVACGHDAPIKEASGSNRSFAILTTVEREAGLASRLKWPAVAPRPEEDAVPSLRGRRRSLKSEE